MASVFKIGTTSGGITSLDGLTVAVPNPQPEYQLFRAVKRLGNMKTKGFGPATVIWSFSILEVGEVTQLYTFLSTSPIYIQTRKQDDSLGIFEVEMNWPAPKQDGDHAPGFYGFRNGLVIEFIILSVVS